MKRIYFCTLLILPLLCSAQNRGNVWCFGDSAGIDFNNVNNPVPISTGLRTRGSCASIADTSGQLLFYANDRTNTPGDYTTLVYNRQHEIMPNGDSIVGEGWYNEIIILPFPDNDSLYYLFNISTVLGPGGLYYSVINMHADSGRGDVILKNIQLSPLPMVDCLAAIKHGNGRDYWLFFRRYVSQTNTDNIFHSYLISPQGIINYTYQFVGSINKTNLGQLKFNSDGSKMVFNNYRGLLEIYDFNRCTGVISNPQTIYPDNLVPPWPSRWSSEFSPNSNYLYVCNTPDTTYLFQYDLNASNIAASEDTLWITSFPTNCGGALKTGKDNKIYLSSVYHNGSFPYPYADSIYNMYNMNLSVINFPDNAGTACDFQPYSYFLGGKRTYWGLPNNPNYDLSPLVGSPCDSLTTIEEIPVSSEAELFVYYSYDFQAAFINANKLRGTIYNLEVFDLLGKSIFLESGKISPPYYTKNLNCFRFSRGMYIVTLITDKERLVKRFVVE